MKTNNFKLFIISLIALSAFFAVSAEPAADSKKETPLPPLSQNELKVMKMIGATLNKDGNIDVDGAVVNRRDKSISFDGGVNIRQGPIEVLVSGLKGRTHESLIVTSLDPFKLQIALILAGYRNGPLNENAPLPMGDAFDILIKCADGKIFNADEWLLDENGKDGLKEKGVYVFIGSNFQDGKCLATLEENLININSRDENTILSAKLKPDKVNTIYNANTSVIPAPDLKGKAEPKPEDYWVPVQVILKPRPKAAPAEAKTAK